MKGCKKSRETKNENNILETGLFFIILYRYSFIIKLHNNYSIITIILFYNKIDISIIYYNF